MKFTTGLVCCALAAFVALAGAAKVGGRTSAGRTKKSFGSELGPPPSDFRSGPDFRSGMGRSSGLVYGPGLGLQSPGPARSPSAPSAHAPAAAAAPSPPTHDLATSPSASAGRLQPHGQRHQVVAFVRAVPVSQAGPTVVPVSQAGPTVVQAVSTDVPVDGPVHCPAISNGYAGYAPPAVGYYDPSSADGHYGSPADGHYGSPALGYYGPPAVDFGGRLYSGSVLAHGGRTDPLLQQSSTFGFEYFLK